MNEKDASDAGQGVADDLASRVAALERQLRAAQADGSARERQLLLVLVGLLDGFQRLEGAMKTDTLQDDAKRVLERFSLLRKRLESSLEREGVTRINSLGMPANEELHDVCGHCDAPGTGPEVIVDVDEEGYLHRGAVLRRARVTVAKS